MSSWVTVREEREGVVTLSLSRPGQLNALHGEMAEAFGKAVEELKVSPPQVVILKGEGRAFCAGGDLQWLQEKWGGDQEEVRKEMLQFYRSFLSLRALPSFLIAAVHGSAVGAGLGLASACDVRLVAEGTRLGANFLSLALHPGMGVSHFLPALIGSSEALRWLATGGWIPAERAEALGWAQGLFPLEELEREAFSLADQVAAQDPLALKQLLETVRQDGGLEAALEREARCQGENFFKGKGGSLSGVKSEGRGA